jgi:serine/threonine protein kinase
VKTAPRLWPDSIEPIECLSRARDFEVWDAWDHDRISRVVLKAPRADRADAESARRLRAEAGLLCELSHPNIVRGYGFSEEPRPHLVMETLGGATLARLIDEEGTLELAECAHLGLQIASAIGYLHRRGIVHLDLKPSNLIGEAGRVKLIDLGLAAPFGPGRAGVGTWSYMAPEQVRGESLGPATDVWGLGAVLFECRCGHPPFDDPEIEGVQDRGDSSGEWTGEYPQLKRPARLTGDRAGATPKLDRLILSCLGPDPADRPRLFELAVSLERLLGDEAAGGRYSRSLAR